MSDAVSCAAVPSLLLVRPENRCAADAAVCADCGWTARFFPLLRLQADAAALRHLRGQMARAAAVFWVSPSAVEVGADVLRAVGKAAVHVAVGQGTAAALRRCGADRVAVAQRGNDSAAAAALPLWDSLPCRAEVLIVCGAGGRDEMRVRLREKGFQVACCAVYRRVPQAAEWPYPSGGVPDAVWITSVQLVHLLFAARLPGEVDVQSLLYLTHHRRIAAALSEHGARRVRLLAEAAELPAVLRALRLSGLACGQSV